MNVLYTNLVQIKNTLLIFHILHYSLILKNVGFISSGLAREY